MDQEEENKYVSQLQEVFNSCDTTGTGYLDKEELTDLCHKLHLETQLPLLLQTLLGNDLLSRVNFEEFKEGFVAVLSSTIDISISDDDESSYLEPVIPEEVQPKFVKGNKRYGRHTHPEREAVENEANKYLQDKDQRKNQLRRSSSLESVESLKSDEEAEIVKEPQIENFEAQGQLRTWNPGFFDSPRRISNAHSDMTENQVRDIWEQLGVGHNGYLNRQELATVCKNIGLEDLCDEELEDLFNKLDRDGDGRVSFQEFEVGLFSHAPVPSASTPLKKRHALYQQVEENSHNTASQSLLSGYGGFHLFSSIDDGTGFGNPEQIMIIWEEEGIQDSKDILMSLDFNVEEYVNLLELTTALDNELIATKNRIYLAALASYKHELHHQHSQIEQVTKERDKVKQDLDRAEKRNLQLADEVDDHNSVMESLNESKIKDLEQEYKQRLSTVRTELETEKDHFLQQYEQQKKKLETDLANFQMEEAYLREKLNLSIKENSRLQKEMVEIVGKLSESEHQVIKLQTSIDNILKEKRLADPQSAELFTQEEKFAEIIRQYEIQCRELRDRNDELQMQLETLQSQLSESRYSRLLAKMKDNKLLHHKAKDKIDDGHKTAAKKGISLKPRRSASTAGSCELPASPMNMEVELTKHQVKELQQEIQDLKIQLETKVIYYERELELMKTNFEKERKDTEQNFKLEISELEEQKADLEELNVKYQEVIDSLREQLPKSGHIQEMEKKFEKERAAMEEYYAKEISSLAQRLTKEKDQLEEDLRRTHQHEVHSVRQETEDEVIEKLAQIEAKYTQRCQYLMQQHLNEKNELLRKHDLKKNALIQEHIREMTQWEEREKTLMAQWKKDQLRVLEKQNEDQVDICKSFAIEKERVETHYRDHINGLNQEIEGLNALLMKAKNSCVILRKQQQSVEKGPPCVEVTTANRNQQVHPLFSVNDEADTVQLVCDVHHLQENTSLTRSMDDEPSSERVAERHKRSPCAQKKKVSFSIDMAEGRSLNEAEENTLINLKETEGLVTSLTAQLQEQTKTQQTLMKEKESFEGEKEHLSSLLETRTDKCKLSEDMAKELVSQLQESRERVQKLESMLQLLGIEKKELETQEAALAGNVDLDYKLKLLRGEEVVMAAQQDLAGNDVIKNVYQSPTRMVTVEDLVAKNTVLLQQLSNNEEQVSILQRQIGETVSKCQQMEEWATKQVQEAREELESEKNFVKDRLFELEDLVRRLEQQTSACQDDRMELDRLSDDNTFLRNKVERFQQEILNLEDLNKKYRIQIEDFGRDTDEAHGELEDINKQNQEYQDELCRLNTQHQEAIHNLDMKLEEISGQKDEANSALVKLQDAINGLEEEKLQQELSWQKEREHLEHELQITKQENEKYWDELCQVNAQSLQLTSTVSDLSSQRETSYETIQELNARLSELSVEKHESATQIEELQAKLNVLEKEGHHSQSEWQKKKAELQNELQIAHQERDKTQNELLQLNCAVSDLKAQNDAHQEVVQQMEGRLREITQQKEEVTESMEKLQVQLCSVQREKVQQEANWQQIRERLEHDLQLYKSKIENLILKHKQERQDLLSGLDETNKQLLVMATLQEEISSLKQVKESLEDQCQSVTKLLKETTEQESQIDELKCELKQAQEECKNWKRSHDQLRSELDESHDKLLDSSSKLILVQSQHMREVQQLKEKLYGTAPKDQVAQLQNQLLEEQQRAQQLQERMRFHAEQTNRQLAMQQEEHEKLLHRMEERMQDVEMNLKNVRVMLQEKVDQLNDQLEKNAKSDMLLKDLYVENAQLMKALQVTEQRQKSAEKKNYFLEEKIAALNKVVKKIAPASLAV
ncbi:ninein-like protein isoform X3 [Bufo gargarizans]|uniref:ninein-like protein isoform X3 n=1 Tax=Bufo gargarizans TaxID=30331 RepID=UPI001CF3C8C3|nr:ninein-like protein isoform X3 [Bufo gargarizans]